MKHIITYLKPYGLRMLMGFIIKVVGTFMDLGLPWVLAYIIDEVIPFRQLTDRRHHTSGNQLKGSQSSYYCNNFELISIQFL